MNQTDILARAQHYLPAMTAFLRDLIRIPGESCTERGVIERIRQEMESLSFDTITVDPMGNILGFMGTGSEIIAFDAHIDTVGVGNRDNWRFDPYEGFESETEIGGRGATDQLGGLVSAVYGAKIMQELALIPEQYRVLVTGTVQEEDCDGLCWQYIIKEDHIRPSLVVITEPTDGGIYRGQRGRMEILVEVQGISCHGSAPERGDNAIYKMADILQEIRSLNDTLHCDPFLGKGTVTTSEIFFTSPSRCAVADSCAISLDRRLTFGESWELALEQVRQLPACQKHNARVTMYNYDRPAYTGLVYPTECYFPAWVLPEDHLGTRAMVRAHQALYGEPRVDKWTFSTNGVSIMGREQIPCIGFGPGKEAEAHAPNEKTQKADLVRCAAVYAALPLAVAQG